MIDRRKRSKILSEVKLVENTCKHLQDFLEIKPVQKEVLFSHKLQDHENIRLIKIQTFNRKLSERCLFDLFWLLHLHFKRESIKINTRKLRVRQIIMKKDFKRKLCVLIIMNWNYLIKECFLIISLSFDWTIL